MPITAPTRPNVGIQKNYQAKLDRLIKELHRSVIHWLSISYRASGVAEDAAVDQVTREVKRLEKKWLSRFDTEAPKLGKYFASNVKDRTESVLKRTLADVGMSVKFEMTPTMQNAYNAVIQEQVGLIRSIASEHLSDVQGLVMQSVQKGRDLGSLTKAVEERYGLTRRRAALIARDQNNKATATITRTRQLELGLTKAKWLHSAGGRHPRPSHVAASGQEYDIEKGMLIDGEWILPGEKINCRCVCRTIVPGFD